MKKILKPLFTTIGIISFIIALFSAYCSLIAFLERSANGSGLFFADVEIFSAFTIFFLIFAVISFLVVRKLRISKTH
jgi:hypothetical protein